MVLNTKRLKVHLPTFTTGFVLPSIKIVYYQHLLVSFEGLLSLRLSDHFALLVGCINNNWLNLWKKRCVEGVQRHFASSLNHFQRLNEVKELKTFFFAQRATVPADQNHAGALPVSDHVSAACCKAEQQIYNHAPERRFPYRGLAAPHSYAGPPSLVYFLFPSFLWISVHWWYKGRAKPNKRYLLVEFFRTMVFFFLFFVCVLNRFFATGLQTISGTALANLSNLVTL